MNYLILSEGEYSNYTAHYWAGEKFISEEDFKAKGVEIGDKLTEWFYSLPETKNSDRLNGEEEISTYELANMWRTEMHKWLEENGYHEIEANGEVNISYSDIPTSKGPRP